MAVRSRKSSNHWLQLPESCLRFTFEPPEEQGELETHQFIPAQTATNGFPSYSWLPSLFVAGSHRIWLLFYKQLLRTGFVLSAGAITALSLLLPYLLYINRIHRVFF